ncbi:MAG: Amidohydrolase [Chloroflexi bacterium]|nr:Amidohydrolase [Chloroflexota bacterium]
MSINGHVVVDMDSHIREYEDLDRSYRNYMDPAYRDAYERLSAAVARHAEAGLRTKLFMGQGAVIEPSDESRPLGMYDTFGVVPPRGSQPTSRHEPIPVSVNWDPAVRLNGMDQARVDISVMFSSNDASFCALHDVGFEGALHRAFHRYMVDYCAEAVGRLRWVITAGLRDIPATVAEIQHWAEQDTNLVGVHIPPVCPDGSLLDNPALHPLFQCAQDLDLPLLVHGGVQRPPHTAGTTELTNAGFLLRAVYQPWSGMIAIGALIGGGAFDLFSRLRVGVFETRAGWMPWLFEQLDAGYEHRPDLTPFLHRLPSEVLAEGRLFHAVEPGERYVEHCVQELGEDIWLFGTDYPHRGSAWPRDVDDLAGRPALSETAKYKILGENALRLCPRIAA